VVHSTNPNFGHVFQMTLHAHELRFEWFCSSAHCTKLKVMCAELMFFFDQVARNTKSWGSIAGLSHIDLIPLWVLKHFLMSLDATTEASLGKLVFLVDIHMRTGARLFSKEKEVCSNCRFVLISPVFRKVSDLLPLERALLHVRIIYCPSHKL